MQKARIFVIHSEKDNYILKRLIHEYQEQTFGKTTLQICFIDSRLAPQLGKDFGDVVEHEIASSCYVIAIVTPNSKNSVWVNQEIGYARGAKKDILPMKEKSMARKGLGFIHSNIDAQLFHARQRRFPKLDRFFTKEFGEKASKVVKTPFLTKATKESSKTSIRRIEPYVV
jgi:hypothetical protein